jgi:hypothetical protein
MTSLKKLIKDCFNAAHFQVIFCEVYKIEIAKFIASINEVYQIQ